MKQTLLSLLLPVVVSAALTPSVFAQNAVAPGTSGKINAADILLALKNSQSGQTVNYRGYTITGELNLFELPETDGSTGKERVVLGSLDFRDAVFENTITTWDQGPGKELSNQPKVRFAAGVDFNGAQFKDHVNLDAAIFNEDAYWGARFYKMGSFTEARFEKWAGFSSAQFDERALFRKVTFVVQADFAMTVFKWIAFFDEAKFSTSFDGVDSDRRQRANFLYARFNDQANFAKAEFFGVARFMGTQFHGLTYFSDAKFHDQVWFLSGARFDDTLSFRRAQFFRKNQVEDLGRFRDPVLFNGVIFAREANFADCHFERVDFGQVDWLSVDNGTDTVFRQRADFRGSSFAALGLRRVSFQSEVDFSEAKLNGVVNVTDLDIANASLRLEWSKLMDNTKSKLQWQGVFENGNLAAPGGNRTGFSQFLATLEKAYQKSGQLDDAGEVHFFSEDLKRKEKGFASGLLDTVFMKWIYGYGVRPTHQLWTAFLLVVAFALAYAKRGVLRRDPSQSRALQFHIADFPVDWANSGSTFGWKTSFGPVRRFLRALVFSSYVFFKVGIGGMVVAPRYKNLVRLEWALGLLIWIIFLVNLSSRWPVLHRLFTAAI